MAYHFYAGCQEREDIQAAHGLVVYRDMGLANVGRDVPAHIVIDLINLD